MSEAKVAMPTANRRAKVLSQVETVNEIRQAIVAGRLIPGQRLIEADVSELLGSVSRSTVRAALTVLVHEGLVQRIDNKGARVREVNLQEGLQIVEMRSLLEGHCAARAAERITDNEIVELRRLAERIKGHVKQGDTMGFIEDKEKVVDTYVRIADHTIAKEILVRLRDRNANFRSGLAYRPRRPQLSLPFWLKTIDAICRRDPRGAKLAVQTHMKNVMETMKAMQDEKPPMRIPVP